MQQATETRNFDAMTENRIKALYFKAKELAEESPELGLDSIVAELSAKLDSYQNGGA